MKFALLTHVPHGKDQNAYYAYAPYVREMNVWLKYADTVTLVAPFDNGKPTAIDLAYQHPKINFKKIPALALTSPRAIFKTVFHVPLVFFKIIKAMQNADHIHLRCPGNIGLLGCLIQILFPSKTKTAKYAGNWDPKAKQPWSYRVQKWILSTPFLTKNMQVLVYGNWENQSTTIKSFFTATYLEAEKEKVQTKSLDSELKFIFIGSLVQGKRPLYAIKIVQELIKRGNQVTLTLYGEGIERSSLETYIENNKLQESVFLKGNQSQEEIKRAYQNSHFVVMPSKSEGWPKAVAEAMFWGCLPLATPASCVPNMLHHGSRGILLTTNLPTDANEIVKLIHDTKAYNEKCILAAKWSRIYTLDYFECEIKKLLQA